MNVVVECVCVHLTPGVQPCKGGPGPGERQPGRRRLDQPSAKTVILLHHPLSVSALIGTERERQQNDSLANG